MFWVWLIGCAHDLSWSFVDERGDVVATDLGCKAFGADRARVSEPGLTLVVVPCERASTSFPTVVSDDRYARFELLTPDGTRRCNEATELVARAVNELASPPGTVVGPSRCLGVSPAHALGLAPVREGDVWVWLLACSGTPDRTEPMTCTPPEPGASPPTAVDPVLAGIDFVLECWDGWEPVTDVHLSFGEQDLSLDTGCQGLDAGYSIEAGVLSLLDTGTTDVDVECGRQREDQESWLLTFFGSGPVLTYEPPVLTLVGTDATLWFTDPEG